MARKRISFYEFVARRNHIDWVDTMQGAGVHSRPDPEGVEQICDWDYLSPTTKARNISMARRNFHSNVDAMDDYAAMMGNY
jgi:hypothetical protein